MSMPIVPPEKVIDSFVAVLREHYGEDAQAFALHQLQQCGDRGANVMQTWLRILEALSA